MGGCKSPAPASDFCSKGELLPLPPGLGSLSAARRDGALGHTSGWEVPPREEPAPRCDASQGGSHFIAAPRRPWEGARHGRLATPRGHPSPAPSPFVLLLVLRPRNVPTGSILPEHRPHLPSAEVALWEQRGPWAAQPEGAATWYKTPEATPGRTYMKGGPQKVTPPLPFTKAISRDVSPPGRCQRSQGHTGAAMARPALLCLDRAPGPGRESLREQQQSGGHGSFRPRVRRARPTPAGGRPLTLRLPHPPLPRR